MSLNCKIVLALTLASTVLISAPAFTAHSGGFSRGSGNTAMHNPNRGGHMNFHPGRPNWHRHAHFRHGFIAGRYFVRPVGYVVPVAAIASPRTCLTKEYTPEGVVVFKELCTNEMASAQVEGSEPSKASESTSPNNFAGRSYQDYLAANQSGEQKN